MERRNENRFEHLDHLIVKVVSAPADSGQLSGRTFLSSSADISRGGLRVLLDEVLPVGARVSLWVRRIDRSGTVVLAGEVRWVKPSKSEGPAQVGIHVLPGPDGTMIAWKNMITAKKSGID